MKTGLENARETATPRLEFRLQAAGCAELPEGFAPAGLESKLQLVRSEETPDVGTAKLRRRWGSLALAVFCFCGFARANDFATAFDTANQLYMSGHFADAASAYDAMIQTGNLSEAILFNRGNALFREGHTGLAIASYREAQLLAPRDPDLRANLEFARTRARGGAPYHDRPWKSWLDRLSLNEWTALGAAAFWVFLLLLAAAQWRKEFRAALGKYIFAAGVAALFLGACLAVEFKSNYLARSAIVTAAEADIRHGPFDTSPSLYKVRDGIELDVLDHKDNWLEVVDSARPIGWIRRDQVVLFQPAALAQAMP